MAKARVNNAATWRVVGTVCVPGSQFACAAEVEEDHHLRKVRNSLGARLKDREKAGDMKDCCIWTGHARPSKKHRQRLERREASLAGCSEVLVAPVRDGFKQSKWRPRWRSPFSHRGRVCDYEVLLFSFSVDNYSTQNKTVDQSCPTWQLPVTCACSCREMCTVWTDRLQM